METWKRFQSKRLTHSMAHYIQAIAAATSEGHEASVGQIADRLGVSKAGVTSMLRTLSARGLASHERYGDVKLTEEGKRLASRTERSRDVLTEFFTEILGLPGDLAEEDACMIEHLVSPASMVQLLRLTAFLRSNNEAAVGFRAAFHAYVEGCEEGSSPACPVCKGACLRHAFDEIDDIGPESLS
jgi:DtxR family Mn-dependent transcriptional regulator